MLLIKYILTALVVAVGHILAAQTRLHPTSPQSTDRTQTNTTTTERILHRDRRFLLWEGGGISKTILGILIPVQTYDRVNWRSLNLGYNFHLQYVPVPSVIYPWTRFERKLHEQRFGDDATNDDKGDNFGKYDDSTRRFAYASYEMIMQRRGHNGRQCLQRAICEAAQTPIEHVGVFDEMLQLFLTPNDGGEVDDDYVDAKRAGSHGADCLSLYAKCPLGTGLLDRISYFKG